tara:strand:- start:140 stop:856 length:717 start_codon:yes stop_codon:yes gene_type:complete
MVLTERQVLVTRARRIRRFLALSISALCVVCGVAAGMIWGTLRSYVCLEETRIVAMVECWPSVESSKEFRLVLRPYFNDQFQPAHVFQMSGTQWALRGDLIVAGSRARKPKQKKIELPKELGEGAEELQMFLDRLQSGEPQRPKQTKRAWFKITVVEGLDDAGESAITYDVHGGSDWLWKAVHRWQDKLPKLKGVQLYSGKHPPDANRRFVVLTGPSGMLVKSQRWWPRQNFLKRKSK